MRVLRMSARPLEEGPENWPAGKLNTASQGGISSLQVYRETEELELLKMCAAQSGGLIFWWRGGKWLQHHFILG